jgi:hypothetical protein
MWPRSVHERVHAVTISTCDPVTNWRAFMRQILVIVCWYSCKYVNQKQSLYTTVLYLLCFVAYYNHRSIALMEAYFRMKEWYVNGKWSYYDAITRCFHIAIWCHHIVISHRNIVISCAHTVISSYSVLPEELKSDVHERPPYITLSYFVSDHLEDGSERDVWRVDWHIL